MLNIKQEVMRSLSVAVQALRAIDEYGYERACDALNDDGVMTAQNKPWSYHTLYSYARRNLSGIGHADATALETALEALEVDNA